MNAQTRRATWTSAGLLLALTVGAPAMADDTELLLVTPDTGSKPNILFILDTSGSMDDEVMTQEPYDASQTYAGGSCDAASVYWTDVDIAPDCSSTTQRVANGSFVCNAATGQLTGIGSYSDTMVQHRATGVAGVSRWQELEQGNASDLVECQADSGKHGDGTAGNLWASNGSDGNAFTNNSNIELGWGSAPATVTYTVYDGNYLNWKNSPATVSLPKIDILKAVTSAVLNSITDVNVGVMRFNNNLGGPVIKAISDLETDRTSILTTIDSLDADGSTPLSETFFESALYWRGVNAHYGETVNQYPTDPAALDSTGPENYRQPQTNVCSKNFNILLSDGVPNGDLDTPGLINTLPGYAAGLGRADCNGTGEGRCLDDIAEYLSKVDIDVPMAGDQFVTTHTIGFDIDLDILRNAAEISGGKYFLANDVESLALAMLNIISEITERSLSFSAPAVAVNTFNRTQNLNDLYMTVFSSKTNVHWPGNLKKYGVDNGRIVDANGLDAVNPATGFFFDSALSMWTDGAADGSEVTLGGAAHELPAPVSRNLYTNNGNSNALTAANNAISPANSGAFAAADFGLTGATGEPTIDEMIRWMRGEDIRNEDFDPTTTVRNAMGDPLHSQPGAVVYGGSPSSPDIVVFTGTNDGYLHAVNGNTGQELWSFVPRELLTDMNRLFFDPKSNFKHYGIDGNIVPVINDSDGDGEIEGGDGDFVYILFGMRRGGDSYYALDVTNKNAPVLLWQAQYPEFGQSWSTPVVTRMNINDPGLNSERAVVVIGGGYDPVHDTRAHPATADAQGAGIHILDLESGARLWRVGADGGADLQLASMTRAIPTQIRVIDVSGDGQADRMYASDLGGQLWRFDITNGETPANLVAGGVIARLGAEGLGSPSAADTRRFYNAPDVSIFIDPLQARRYISISIGSGYRAHPLDESADDRFFSVRDPDVFTRLDQNAYDNYDIVTDTDLVEISGQVRVVLDSDDRGWKFTMPPSQAVIANSVTFDNSVFFVGFSPEANTFDPCQPSNGRNFLYQVSVINGDPVVNNLDAVLPADADAERVTELAQGGIAATPAFLFPGPNDPDCEGAACSPPPIGCVGVECFDPGFINNPVRTLWTQDGIE
ncbi:MAG: PilC/PilY family type IV pilus protein [Woeseia sp.]